MVLVATALALIALSVMISSVLAAASPTAERDLLGAFKNPLGAKGRTLGLSIVTIPAGVTLPLHHHLGTQVSYIQKGILRYTVRAGRVRVMKGLADQSPQVVRTISAGQTASLTPGEWIVEQPSDIHMAMAKTRVVVLIASLLKNGAPAATPVMGLG
jgi:quercetin dioxygenase-like cupin family protein